MHGLRFLDIAVGLNLPFNFSATPADVSLLMQLGVDGVFVGSGIFKSNNPEKRAKAMAMAVTHYQHPKILAEVSEDLGEAMVREVIYCISFCRFSPPYFI